MKPIIRLSLQAALSLAVVAVFIVTGCKLEDFEPASARLQQKHLTISATYEAADDAVTKTVLHNDGHVYWTPGDAISLFYGSGSAGGSRFVAQADSETRVTNFSGEIGVVTGGDEISESDTYFWGLYPYDPEASCDGETVTMRIASVQVGAPDTFASGFAPSLGRASGLMLSFRNVYCGLYFTVTQPGFRSATLRATNGELIAGRAKIGVDSNNYPVVEEILEGTDYVTVTAPTEEGFKVGKRYYLLFFPRTLEGGFTLELSSLTQMGTFSVGSRIPFQRNQISSAVDLDTKVTFETIGLTRAAFPDEHFANHVFRNFDTDGDGVISTAERDAVRSIDLYPSDEDTLIVSLSGIEHFGNIVSFTGLLASTATSNYRFTRLDLSANHKIQQIQLGYGKVEELDVTGCPDLLYLKAAKNNLTQLDLSANTSLSVLSCEGNRLTSLNVASNPALEYLNCDGNQLTSLNVGLNTALTSLWCGRNQLTSLDVSSNTALTYLNCSGNNLASLNVGNNQSLVTLSCQSNGLTSLDLSGNVKLQTVDCSGNALSSIDLSICPNIGSITVDSTVDEIWLMRGKSYVFVTRDNVSQVNNDTRVRINIFEDPAPVTFPTVRYKSNVEKLPDLISPVFNMMVDQYRTTQGFNGEGTIRLWYGAYGGSSVSAPLTNSSYENHFMSHRLFDVDNPNEMMISFPLYYYYRIINSANAVLEGLESIDQPEEGWYKGSLLGLRAYAYLMLSQIYGKSWNDDPSGSTACVPLRLSSSEDITTLASLAEVYEVIYRDLDEAIALMQNVNVTRPGIEIIDLDAVYAIYAKAALTRGEWSRAAQFAGLARSGHPLMSNSQYGQGFSLENDEWIWGASADCATGVKDIYYYSYFSYIGYNSTASALRTYPKSISRQLFEAIPATDFRRTLFLDPGESGYSSTGLASSELDSYARSYAQSGGRKGIQSNARVYAWMQFKFSNLSQSGIGQQCFIRAAEMLLIEAEAQFRMGNQAMARSLLVELNKVSGRDPAYTCELSGETLMDEIKFYRTIELWGEGFDLFDIKRWGDSVTRKSFDDGGNFLPALAGTWSPSDKNGYVVKLPENYGQYVRNTSK